MALFDRFLRWRTPVAVPVAETDGSYAGTERRAKQRINAQPGTRILVVDDSATILVMMRKMLKQNAYQVFEAEDVASATRMLEETSPDLIFLDIVLPDGDGFQVLRSLRRQPHTRDIPVIMMSGNSQATEQFYVQRIGADDFMKKPFSRAEVFSRIEALLDADCIPRRTAQRMGVPAALA